MQCPVCDSGFDAASAVDGEDLTPEPGDITICLYCGEWMMFDDDTLPTLKPSAAEMRQAPAELLLAAERLRLRWKARKHH